MLVDACELPLDFYLQSLLVWYWYRLQRLPDSLALKAVNNQRFFNFYQNHLNFLHPFGFRISLILADLNIYKGPVLAFQYSVIPPWDLPAVMFCRYFSGSKRNLSDSEIRSIFLDHKDEHKNLRMALSPMQALDLSLFGGI